MMLRCLVTKAAIDQEKNEASARDIWEKILDPLAPLGPPMLALGAAGRGRVRGFQDLLVEAGIEFDERYML